MLVIKCALSSVYAGQSCISTLLWVEEMVRGTGGKGRLAVQDFLRTFLRSRQTRAPQISTVTANAADIIIRMIIATILAEKTLPVGAVVAWLTELQTTLLSVDNEPTALNVQEIESCGGNDSCSMIVCCYGKRILGSPFHWSLKQQLE